jgi:hypothetical protein
MPQLEAPSKVIATITTPIAILTITQMRMLASTAPAAGQEAAVTAWLKRV